MNNIDEELITNDRYELYVHTLQDEFNETIRRIESNNQQLSSSIEAEVELIAERLNIMKSVLIARDDVNRYASLLSRAKSTFIERLIDSLHAFDNIEMKSRGKCDDLLNVCCDSFLDLQTKVDVDKCTNGSDSSDSGVHVNLGNMDIGYECFIINHFVRFRPSLRFEDLQFRSITAQQIMKGGIQKTKHLPIDERQKAFEQKAFEKIPPPIARYALGRSHETVGIVIIKSFSMSQLVYFSQNRNR